MAVYLAHFIILIHLMVIINMNLSKHICTHTHTQHHNNVKLTIRTFKSKSAHMPGNILAKFNDIGSSINNLRKFINNVQVVSNDDTGKQST